MLNSTRLSLYWLMFLAFAVVSNSWAIPDTLEIYAIRVEFKFEDPDNSLTTGRGLFDSDADTASANYSLDPMGNRASPNYWIKHIEFANRYFQAASQGRLVIESKIYPRSKRSYVLDKGIIDYNRTARKKDEKVAEFDDARSKDYMTFIWDALHKASQDPTDSPFSDSLPASSQRKRVFLIIHAGASRLVDGGSLGTSGADTPGDFMDIFVSKGEGTWGYLSQDSLRSASKRGFVLSNSPIDTVHEVMVMSETASQDGLNWGINGMLVNQIGQQIGMPQTYDVVKGISRLGAYDVMDFAGYSAGYGFLPVLPSAWVRAYMGWANVTELRPDQTGKALADLNAAGLSLGSEILKISLSPTEYLLLENRQRTLDSNGLVTLDLDGTEVEIPVDSLHLMFQDSVCNDQGAKCKKNPRKARGIITGVSSYDAGLPGSGVAIWHVNEWVLRESLPYGAVNFWAGDTFRDHHYGIGLMEADRIPSIGKEFKNALGQPAYDYGSGADLLPHLRVGSKDGKSIVYDTMKTLEPQGYTNTASTFGGYSGLQIQVLPGPGAKSEKTANSFMGDSVINWRSSLMKLVVDWRNFAIANSEWPRQTMSQNYPGRGLLIDLPGSMDSLGLGVAVLSQDGSLQIFGEKGQELFPSSLFRDVNHPLIADSMEQVPIWRLGVAMGPSVGLAAVDNYLYSLHTKRLVRTQLTDAVGQIGFTQDSIPVSGATSGPLITNGQVWFADSIGMHAWVHQSNSMAFDATWPQSFVAMDMALCGDLDQDGVADVVAVGQGGKLAVAQSATGRIVVLPIASGWTEPGNSTSEWYSIACTDFNRDGRSDAFVLGNYGSGWIVDVAQNRLLSPARQYSRGQRGGTVVAGGDAGAIALADLDGNGFPEAIFSGYNRLYAVDSSGVPIAKFPVVLTRGYPEEVLRSSPLVLDVDGNGKADVLMPLASGNVIAINSNGQLLSGTWPRMAGFYAYDSLTQPLGLWIGKAQGDSLQMYATHRDYVGGWRMPGSLARPAMQWLDLKGSPTRQSWLDPNSLEPVGVLSNSYSIDEFILFPNPIRKGRAHVRFSLGSSAESVILKVYDISGLEVIKMDLGAAGKGRNQKESLDFGNLGSDVYSAKLEVRFVKGQNKTKWDRIAVVR